MKVPRLDISRPWRFFEREEQLKQIGKTCFLQKQTVKHSPGLVREKKPFAGQSEMRQISLTELMK